MKLYRLEALDSEQCVLADQEVAFSTLDNVIILRLRADVTQSDVHHIRDVARREFPERRSVIVIAGDVEFLRVVEVPKNE